LSRVLFEKVIGSQPVNKFLPFSSIILLLLLLLLLLEALQLQKSFGLLSEFLPFDPVSDAVLPI
jgi:hypothetical protein